MADTTMLIVLCGLVGAIAGSFLNVVIHRVPRGESIVSPRSHCPSCGRVLRPWENVPLLAFIWLRGRCAGCGTRIPFRYPLVEALTAGLFAAVGARFGFGPALPFLLFFVGSLVAVAWIDLDARIIPDAISLGGLGIGLVASFFLPVTLPSALLGAIIGGGTLWLLAAAYRKATGVDGMGGGDIKLAAMIGAFLGPGSVLFTLFLASVLGVAVGGALMLAGRAGRRTALPFGTFLAPAAVVSLFAAPVLFAWYAGWVQGAA